MNDAASPAAESQAPQGVIDLTGIPLAAVQQLDSTVLRDELEHLLSTSANPSVAKFGNSP